MSEKENGVPVYGSGERPKTGPSVTFATQVQRTGDVSAPSSQPSPPQASFGVVEICLLRRNAHR